MSRPRAVQDFVTRQACRRADARAVVMGKEAVTYGSLVVRARQLARALDEVGCFRGDRIALLMPKSPLAVTAMLGVYEADGILVPLDVGSPAARLARILRSCEPRLLLAAGGGEMWQRRILELARATGVAVGWLGPEAPGDLDVVFTAADVSGCPRILRREGGRSDVAHLLYTSGSTGEPKGVAVRHRSIIDFVSWAVTHFGIRGGERLSGHAPLSFDLSTFDLFGAFAAGAELHLVPPELSLLPHRLAAFIRGAELTQWFSVPSVLNQMAHADVVTAGDFPALRRLLWCGEVFPVPSLRYFMKRLPHVAFTNLYGPTETTIASSYHDVTRCPEEGDPPVPIGRACAGEELLVLDADLRKSAPGCVGELWIGGAGLAEGYFRDPERTRAAFPTYAPEGEPPRRIYRTGDLAFADDRGLVHLVGRIDGQIKSRGYRIELGEIESAVATTGLAQESVVTALPSEGFEGTSIGCAYVPVAGRTVPPAELLQSLSRLVPGYMLPARLLPLREIRKTGNGKLDRLWVKELLQADARPERSHDPRASSTAGL